MTKTYLPQNVYDLLKRVVTLVLPAAGSFYFGLAGIWGLPAADKVVGTLALATTFLGLIVHISSKRFQKDTQVGDLVVSTGPDGLPKFATQMDKTPEELAAMDKIQLTVVNDPNEGFLSKLPPSDENA